MTICEECGNRVKVESPQTVTELQREMAQVDDLMTRLTAHRTVLRQRINALAPISLLPPEILTDIFSLACHNPPTTPLFFGSICTAWRTLAWGTPTLWSTITLKITHPEGADRDEVQRGLLGEWLERAGTLPLAIKLFTVEEDEETFRSFANVMRVLVRRAEFWGSVECLLPPGCHDILVYGADAGLAPGTQRGRKVGYTPPAYPRLRKVLFRPPKGTISTFNQPPDMFRNAPLLTDVDLSGYDFSSMVLPWTQLRKFHTQFVTVSECLKVLNQSPNMQRCYFDNVYQPDLNHQAAIGGLQGTSNHALTHPAARAVHLVHTSLTALDVTLVKGPATSLLDALSLPALRELGLHYVGAESVPLRPVISLVSRSGCALRVLSVTRPVWAEEDLLRCLEAVPSLRDVRVCVRETVHVGAGAGANGVGGLVPQAVGGADGAPGLGGLSERFVKALLPHVGGMGTTRVASVLLPKLRVFSYEGPILCPVATILDVVEARWRKYMEMGVARLECVSLAARGRVEMGEGDVRRVEGLMEEGMRVYVSPVAF